MRRSFKAFTGLAAILILAAGCTQSPTGVDADNGSGDGTQRGVYAYGEGN
jgi:hypothetical protein